MQWNQYCGSRPKASITGSTYKYIRTRDGVLEAMALASRPTGHVLGLGGQVLGLGCCVLGLGLRKHVLGLDHFRLMCLVLCPLY